MDVFSPGVKHAFRKLDIENTEVVSPRSTSGKVNIWNLLQSPVTDVGASLMSGIKESHAK